MKGYLLGYERLPFRVRKDAFGCAQANFRLEKGLFLARRGPVFGHFFSGTRKNLAVFLVKNIDIY